MFEWLRPEDLNWLLGVVTLVIVTVVEKSKAKYKPWSWLAQQFGSAINKEMLDKLDTLTEKVDELEKADEIQKEGWEKEKALEARRRILGFADECRRKIKHSEEYFNNILEDISFYKDYCAQHPLFENEKAIIAMSIITSAYKHCYENDDFL